MLPAREDFYSKDLNYLILYKNDCKSIQWTSGCTGLVKWNSPGLDLDKCQSFVSLEFSFIFR
jgi:hypothetical protein